MDPSYLINKVFFYARKMYGKLPSTTWQRLSLAKWMPLDYRVWSESALYFLPNTSSSIRVMLYVSRALRFPISLFSISMRAGTTGARISGVERGSLASASSSCSNENIVGSQLSRSSWWQRNTWSASCKPKDAPEPSIILTQLIRILHNRLHLLITKKKLQAFFYINISDITRKRLIIIMIIQSYDWSIIIIGLLVHWIIIIIILWLILFWYKKKSDELLTPNYEKCYENII